MTTSQFFILVFLAMFFSFSVSGTILSSAFGQGLPSLRPNISEDGTFQDEDGFKFTVPDGWVVQDVDWLSVFLNSRTTPDPMIFTITCPQQEALPAIGGLYNCEQAENSMEITRYARLQDRPQFGVIENPLDITPDDFLAFLIGDFQRRGYTNIQIVNSTDRTVNVTSEDNPNTVLRSLPAKFAEITYQPSIALPELRVYTILTTVPEEFFRDPAMAGTSTGIISGDSLIYEGPAATTPSGRLPTPEIQQIFDSFELMR